MSFDPFHEQQPLRDPAPKPPLDDASAGTPAPLAGAPPADSGARERVLFPAILLIVTGVIDLLIGGFALQGALSAPPTDELVATVKKESAKDPQKAAQMAKIEQAGYSLEGLIAFYLKFMLAMGVSNVVVAPLLMFAGVRMLQLRGYGLALFASFLAAIPFVSGSGCCCIGEVAGLYSIIMLFQTDIRSAFR